MDTHFVSRYFRPPIKMRIREIIESSTTDIVTTAFPLSIYPLILHSLTSDFP